MYQPTLRPDQVEALYHLKIKLRTPMTRILQNAVDCFLEEIKHKEDLAVRRCLTLQDWLAYEEDMKAKASDAAKQPAGPQDGINARF